MLLIAQISLASSIALLYQICIIAISRWPRISRRVVFWGVVPACALLSLLLADALVRGDRSYDFAAFYAAGQLAGTPELYSRSALAQAELAAHATTYLPFLRPPTYALALKLLTFLPAETARLFWAVLNAAALLAGIQLWPGLSRASRWAALAAFFPTYYVLSIGQDTPLVLLFCALAARLMANRRDIAGGLALSLCAIKFSLCLALPIVLIASRRWKVFGAAAAGVAVQFLFSWAIQGSGWPLQYAAAFVHPEADIPDHMPNLRGLLSWLPFGQIAEIVAAVAIGALVYRCARSVPLPVALAGGLAAGQILSHHGFSYDALVLLPLIVIGLERVALRHYALALLGPICFMVPRLYPLRVSAIAGHLVIIGATLAIIFFLSPRVSDSVSARQVERASLPS